LFNVIIFKCAHVIKTSGRVTTFRRVRKAAKRDYQLRHLCPSTHMEQLGFRWTHFVKIVYWDPFIEVCRENSKFVEAEQQHKALYMKTKYTCDDNRLIFPGMRKSSDQRRTENRNTHLMSPENRRFYKVIMKNTAPKTGHTRFNITWRKKMRSECRLIETKIEIYVTVLNTCCYRSDETLMLRCILHDGFLRQNT
jgi:hypothetical protein